MKTFTFSTLLFFYACACWGQQHVVSLSQSRKAALAYSNAIKNGTLKVNSAEFGLIGARAAYLPSVSATGTGLYGFKDFIPAIPPLLTKGVDNIYLLSVSGTESVYAGGKIKTGEQLAKLQLDVSKLLARQSVDSVLLLTEQKYWNIVNLQEQRKTLIANEALLNKLLDMQKDMLASGLIARNDLLKAKVQLSQLRVNQSKLENNRRLALFDFSIYTGMPYDSLMVMQDSLNKSVLPSPPEVLPDTSLANLTRYQLLTYQIKSEKLQTRSEKSDYLPSVSLGLGASQFGSFNGALKNSFGQTAFASVSIPISEGLWGRSCQKVKQRIINEQIAQNNLRDGSNQLRIAILRNWYDIKDALTQIAFAKDNLQQATENLKVNRDNYKAGLNPVSDVLDAQASYQQAEVTLNTAYTDFQVKKSTYDYATGKISQNIYQ